MEFKIFRENFFFKFHFEIYIFINLYIFSHVRKKLLYQILKFLIYESFFIILLLII